MDKIAQALPSSEIEELDTSMHKRRLVILTEGGKNLGLGHITRCSALYDTAIQSGCGCELIVFSELKDIKPLNGRNSLIVDWKKHGFIESHLNKGDFCIVDSYLADYETYQRIIEASRKCICIDDYARIDYPQGGIIVNPSLHFDMSKYHGKKAYNGIDYVILRKEFLDCERAGVRANVKQILVTMGGTDLRNLTPSIVKLLNAHFPLITVKVIIGEAFDNVHAIKEQAGGNTELIFDADAPTMKETMLQSDFAISAAGQTLFELLATQTPFIPIRIIHNQDENIAALRQSGFIDDYIDYDALPADGKLARAINKMMRSDVRERTSRLYGTVRFNACGAILKLFEQA